MLLLSGIIRAQTPAWNVDIAQYEYDMSLTGVLSMNHQELQTEGHIVGAFVNDECRGIATTASFAPTGAAVFAMMIYSNSPGETIHFRVYHQTDDSVYEVRDSLAFASDEIVGDHYAPHELHIMLPPPDWSINPADFEYDMSFTGILKIYGNESTDPADMLGVFVDDELRGNATLTYYADFDRYFFSMPIYSNLASGEALQFKIYDASQGMIYTLESDLLFNANDIIGDFSDPYPIVIGEVLAADFSADITSGEAPLSVNFTDLSTGTVTSWSWDFDDDGLEDATDQHPTHTYSEAGIYTVALTVTDGTDSDTETKTDYITVSTAGDAITSTTTGGNWSEDSTWVGGVVPTASDNVIIDGDVVVDQNSECVDLTVNSGNILRSGTGFYQNLTVNGVLSNAGTIQNNGDTDLNIELKGDLLNSGTIENDDIYFVGATDQYLSMSSGAVFQNVHFGAKDSMTSVILASDLQLTDCEIDFNYSGETTSLIIPEGSGFNLQLLGANCFATDVIIEGNGNVLYMSQDAYLYQDAYLRNIILTGTVRAGAQSVTFAGDSVVVLDTLQSHTGFYNKLYVNSTLINYGIIKDVGDTELYIETTGNLINYGDWRNDETRLKGLTDQQIDLFGDHTFTSTVEMYAMLGTGSYQWYHNDNAISGETDEYISLDSLSVDEYGTYYCSTNEGNSRHITVSGDSIPPALIADFSAEPTTGTVPLTVQFTDQSSGAPNSWEWDFGDGNSSPQQNPSHTYESVGIYTITLAVSDGENESSEIKDSYISVTEAEPVSYWTTLHPTPTSNSIYDAQFVNSGIGYACGTRGSLIKTTDGGDNWEVINTGVQEHLMKVCFVSENTGYVVGEYGTVLKIENGGETVVELVTENAIGTRRLYSVYFIDANTGFVGGEDGAWKTTDGGTTWIPITFGNNVTINDLDFQNSGGGIAIGNDGAVGYIAKTTDGGDNWTSISSPTIEDLNEIWFIDENTGYIVGDSKTVLKTSDGGSNWDVVSSADSYDDYLDVYFEDVNTGFTITNKGVYKSSDGGASWESMFYQYDYELLTLDKVEASTAFAFSDGGHLLKTDNSWTDYRVINSYTAEHIQAVDFRDIHTGIVVGGDGNIMRTSDGGENWEFIETASSYLFDIKYINSSEAIAVGRNGNVLKSTDDGASWTDISTAEIPSVDLFGFAAPTQTIYFAVGAEGTIVKSADAGNNWTQQTSGYSENLNDLFFIDENTGIAVGGRSFSNESKILKTTDGGETWTDIASPVNEELTAIAFINSTTGFIVGDEGTVLKTSDGGDVWTDVSISSFLSFDDISFVDENFGAMIQFGAVYFTQDGGETWSADETFPAYNSLYGVDFIDDSTAYVVGSDGAILRYRKGEMPPPVSIRETVSISDEYHLYRNYPNPFNPTTTIAYSIPKADFITVRIYDLSGRLTEELVKGYVNRGKHTVVWKADEYPSGVYLVRLNSGAYNDILKIMLMK